MANQEGQNKSNKSTGRLDGIIPIAKKPSAKPRQTKHEPLHLIEDDPAFNPADLATSAGSPQESDYFNEEDNEADQLDESALQSAPQPSSQSEKLEQPEQPERRQPVTEPGQLREADPLNRAENPQTAADQTPPERQASEYGRPAAPKNAAPRDDAPREAAPNVGERITERAERAVKSGEKLAKAGSKGARVAAETATRLAALGARIAAWTAEAVAFIAANWEIILIVVVVVGIMGAVLFGISAIVNDEGNSGTAGGSFAQPASLTDPSVNKAIENLAFLAGDKDAIAKTTREQVEKINGYLIEIEAGVSVNSTAQRLLAEAINEAKTLTEKILASGTKDNSADIAKLYQALDKILAIAYGITVTEPSQIANKAKEIYENRANWVGSKNEQPTNTDAPMRDGRNEINGKRGCDLSGFIVYIIRPTVTDCLICATPNVNDLAKLFSFVFAPQAADNDVIANLQNGDITITTRDKNQGAQVVVDTDGKDGIDTVYYCSATLGPQSETVNAFFGGNRTLNQILRLKYSKEVRP